MNATTGKPVHEQKERELNRIPESKSDIYYAALVERDDFNFYQPIRVTFGQKSKKISGALPGIEPGPLAP
jgi:hypothetical protein